MTSSRTDERRARITSTPRRVARGAICALVALAGLFWPEDALAQSNLPDIAPLGAAPQPSKKPAPSGEEGPETHAAEGGTESTLPAGNEPSLPEDPLAISPEVAERIGSDADPDAAGTGADAKRQFYGLYYNERAGAYRYRVLFPIWAERIKPSITQPKVPDRASLYGGLYYNRRSAEHADDVLFPLFWNLRNPLEKSRSTLVGPFFNRRTKTESDDWFLPLYATGRREVGGYTLIPPLLTSLNASAKGGFNLIGPAFCSWKGGAHCDTRSAHDIDLGLAPFYFFGQNQRRLYEVVPPLLHYYRYDSRTEYWLNVYGPYFREHKTERDLFHLIPIYWSITGKNERHTTVAPLFHYGHKGDENLLITPLFLNKVGEKGEHTFVTWGYARHRGATELDMVTPLYWHHRDPRIGLDRKLLLPFLYTNTSPRESTTVFFPFWAHSERYGLSSSTRITPLFHYGTHTRGYALELYPLLFFGKNGNNAHHVVAPLYFDFVSPSARTTVAGGLFVRHRSLDTLHQIVLNTYYSERQYPNGRSWQFHFLPLFSYGQSPSGHFWNVLFGLTGYSRQGSASTLRLFWAPIPLSK